MGEILIDDVRGILDREVDDGRDSLYVVNPGETTIRALTEVIDPTTIDTRIRLLARPAALKAATADFLIGSAIADLEADDALTIKTLENGAKHALLVSDTHVGTMIALNDEIATLTTDDPEFVERVRGVYREKWEAATPFSNRTPPRSHIERTLASDIGETVREEFAAVLDSVEQLNGARGPLDEVTISILVAARNDILLYDISKWGEDVGIASKATFSRTKTTLEDRGVISTEKVPIEVGRPRLRLTVGHDALAEATPETLAETATELLG